MAMTYPSQIKEKVVGLHFTLHSLELVQAVVPTIQFLIKLSYFYFLRLLLRVNFTITSKLDYLEQPLDLILTGRFN